MNPTDPKTTSIAPPASLEAAQKILDLLGSELITIVDIAHTALDSWPMRMNLEQKMGISEEALERLERISRTALQPPTSAKIQRDQISDQTDGNENQDID